MILTLDDLIVLSHLGLFLVLACWSLCHTEFSQVCSRALLISIKLVLVVDLASISMLILVKNRLRVTNKEQVIRNIYALMYIVIQGVSEL